jgi:hypothetical protein
MEGLYFFHSNRFPLVVCKCLLYSLVIIVICSFILSCSTKGPTVKPDKAGIIHDENSSMKTDVSQTSYKNESQSKEFLDAEKLYRRFWIHIFMIEVACELYHDTYLTLPDELSDLFDGFMLIWPGNVYSNGPVKILDSEPDPDNPDHRGNIYYQRYDSHEATLKFILPDIKNIQRDKTKWITSEQRIVSDTAKLLLNPQEERLKPSSKTAIFLVETTQAERYKYGYIQLISQNLSYLIDDSLIRTGNLDNSLVDLIKGGDYYFIDKGIETIRKNVKEKLIVFDFGSLQNESYFYLDCRNHSSESHPLCRRFDSLKGYSGDIEYLSECPVFDTVKVISSSQEILTLMVPENLVISKKDIL